MDECRLTEDKPGNKVDGETVQAFIGALIGKGAQKGVLITTSAFTGGAAQAARRSGSLSVILIDGDMLTDLMVRFSVGVRLTRSVEIKDVDENYFKIVEGD